MQASTVMLGFIIFAMLAWHLVAAYDTAKLLRLDSTASGDETSLSQEVLNGNLNVTDVVACSGRCLDVLCCQGIMFVDGECRLLEQPPTPDSTYSLRLNENSNKDIPACSDDAVPSRQIDCLSWRMLGHYKDGEYCIKPDGATLVQAVCDMDHDCGGWTVIQQRVDDSTDFYRDYEQYRSGFGDLGTNFWLGLENIHLLSAHQDKQTELYVYLEDFDSETAYAHYSSFSVGPGPRYELHVSGYSGTAGDSMAHHNGHAFTTKDRDMDDYSGGSCAHDSGAWWYVACHESNLNGRYLVGDIQYAKGISWFSFRGVLYSLKTVRMKIRNY